MQPEDAEGLSTWNWVAAEAVLDPWNDDYEDPLPMWTVPPRIGQSDPLVQFTKLDNWSWQEPQFVTEHVSVGEAKHAKRQLEDWYRDLFLGQRRKGRPVGSTRLLHDAVCKYPAVVRDLCAHSGKRSSALSARDIASGLQQAGVHVAESTVRNWLHDGELARPETVSE